MFLANAISSENIYYTKIDPIISDISYLAPKALKI